MSEDAAKAFVERMKADTGFRARVLAVEDPRERLAVINGEGYALTAEDVGGMALLLQDQELQHAVGGVGGLGPTMDRPTSFGGVSCPV